MPALFKQNIQTYTHTHTHTHIQTQINAKHVYFVQTYTKKRNREGGNFRGIDLQKIKQSSSLNYIK